MKTKKLRIEIVTLIICLLAFISQVHANIYYYRNSSPAPSGSPALPSNWTPNANGIGGTSPSATTWTNTAHTLNFYNSSGNVSATLAANWTNMKSGTVLNVGAGSGTFTSSFDFAGFTFNRPGNVSALGTVLSSLANPSFLGANQFAYNAASTTVLSNNNVTVSSAGFNVGYGNLTLSGATATLAGNVIVNGTLTANNIVLSAQQLDVNGPVASLGTITGDLSANINFSNTGNINLVMSQASAGVSNALNLLTYNDGTSTLSATNALCIAPGGGIYAISGTIDITTSGGSLTLLASKGLSGGIGDNSGGTFIATSITSQVVHNPNSNTTTWTQMGSAGLTDAIFAQWESAFPITCPGCAVTSAGGTPFTSVYSYDETLTGGGDYSNSAHYVDLTGDNATINNGQGYWVYMGNTSPGNSTPAEAITVTGTPKQGPLTLNFTRTDALNGYNLFANPYPCPISWSALMTNNPGVNLDGTCYIYNSADGSYGTIDAAGIASSSYGLNNDIVATGMAFYVFAPAAGGSLNFDETVKAVGGAQDLQRQSASTQQVSPDQVPRFSLEASNGTSKGQTLFAFDNRAVTGLDQKIDAGYFPGDEPIKVTSQISGKDLSINGLPDFNQNYSIPVRMRVVTTGTYTISANMLNRIPAGGCLILHDNYTSTDYDLRQGPFSLVLNDTEVVAARFMLNITVTSSSLTATAHPATCPAGGDAYIVATGSGSGPWNYTWKNASSNIVKTSLNKATADTLSALSSGVYVVEVSTVGSCDNASQSFTLTLPAGVSSAFTVSSNTVLVNNSVSFTDNSVNADAWYWEFGDSTTSTLQSPVHTYTNVGTYDAVLWAINTTCGDTAMSQFTTVDVQGATGISHNTNEGFYISKDVAGAFVKFNYRAEAKVAISVYNALGQVLYSNEGSRVTKDKIYLNLDNAKGQMVFVSVINLDENTQVTKKLYNN